LADYVLGKVLANIYCTCIDMNLWWLRIKLSGLYTDMQCRG
jgi:hypothetical protein